MGVARYQHTGMLVIDPEDASVNTGFGQRVLCTLIYFISGIDADLLYELSDSAICLDNIPREVY